MKDLRAHIVTKSKQNYVELVLLSPDKSKYMRTPYTLKAGLIPDEQMRHADSVNRGDDPEIALINANTNKLEKHSMDHVLQMRMVTHEEDTEYNEKHFKEYKARLEDAISTTDMNECDLSKEELYQKYYEVQHDAYKMMSVFNHKLDDIEVLDPTQQLNSDKQRIAHACWLNMLRKYREAAFVELDELEKNTTDRDEIEDINTIKQMFRDIPQDVDMSKLTTVEQIVNFWPPLLLPVPEEVDLYRKYIDKQKYPEIDPLLEGHVLDDILKTVTPDQLPELQALYDILLNSVEVPEELVLRIRDRIIELK